MTDEKVEEKVPDREEEQEEKSSSDEEQAPGELDKPIVILYEKRAKKEVKRFNPVEKERGGFNFLLETSIKIFEQKVYNCTTQKL